MSGQITRRRALQGLAAIAPAAVAGTVVAANASRLGEAEAATKKMQSDIGPYSSNVLPDGVRSRFVHDINGLTMHVLEAGFEDGDRPGVLLLHGFPELAYSWRNVMVPLADAGYHVIAPDQRGYGRTTGWDVDYDDDLAPFRMLNLVRDALGLVLAMGHRSIAVVGHDFGSPVAAWSAVARPDVFTSVTLMSAPFGGTAELPFDTADAPPTPRAPAPNLNEALANLARPRKHYQSYYTTREADENMWHAPQGLQAFLRGYYHYKSADWPDNKPFKLKSPTAAEMAKMPTYYIMELADGMAETVAKHMPSPREIAANTWLPEDALRVYATEYARTGFQGGLNWYRSGGIGSAERQLFAGRKIDQPSLFIAGTSDWGSYQSPGSLERMQTTACSDMRAVHMVPGAGHWVQQEQPEATSRLLIDFLELA